MQCLAKPDLHGDDYGICIGGSHAIFMRHMYTKKRVNIIILATSAIVFAGSLWLQPTFEDTSWMKAMIPRHSIAILTSDRANLSDPRIQGACR